MKSKITAEFFAGFVAAIMAAGVLSSHNYITQIGFLGAFSFLAWGAHKGWYHG